MGRGAPSARAVAPPGDDGGGPPDQADKAAGEGDPSPSSSLREAAGQRHVPAAAAASASSGPVAAPASHRHGRPPSGGGGRPGLRRSGSSLGASLRDVGRDLRRRSGRSLADLGRRSSSALGAARDGLPATPTGWALLSLSAASAGLQREVRLQGELSAPPAVFCQGAGGGPLNARMGRLHGRLTGGEGGALSRTVTPSLFVGTRGIASSAAAYALGDRGRAGKSGGKRAGRTRETREVMRMAADGALIVVDWEVPAEAAAGGKEDERPDVTEPGGIDRPVVLIVHGMNNDSTFGYVRSMMRTAADRGWIAACMNMRGQDGLGRVRNATPRGYNAGFTGDLRGVVERIGHRLRRKASPAGELDVYDGGPVFLVGYSLGANIVTKYLGEEGLHGTLPPYVAGGCALGNPLRIHSGTIGFPWNVVLGAGVKRSILQNLPSFARHHDPGYRRAMARALLAPTIGRLDDAASPYLVRNDNFPPYARSIGYEDGEDYWRDSSSHRYVPSVSVPLLQVAARDDFIVFGQFARNLDRCLESPNVIVVKTRCGGHLGWQESPPPGSGGGGSWSDAAVADFIEALLQMREEDRAAAARERGETFTAGGPRIRSRL